MCCPFKPGNGRAVECNNNATWSTTTTNPVSAPLTGPGNAIDAPFNDTTICAWCCDPMPALGMQRRVVQPVLASSAVLAFVAHQQVTMVAASRGPAPVTAAPYMPLHLHPCAGGVFLTVTDAYGQVRGRFALGAGGC